jgi:hypothetical protein
MQGEILDGRGRGGSSKSSSGAAKSSAIHILSLAQPYWGYVFIAMTGVYPYNRHSKIKTGCDNE